MESNNDTAWRNPDVGTPIMTDENLKELWQRREAEEQAAQEDNQE